jgi:aminopeptidase N
VTEEKFTARLWEPVQAWQVIKLAWEWAKSMLMARNRLTLEIRKETRSSAQNRLLHALFADVAAQAEWMGKKRSATEWKVLFVSAHSVATREGAEFVPGLENEAVNIRESTARMSKARLSSLVEYVMAWAAQNGVELRESAQWVTDPETGEIG